VEGTTHFVDDIQSPAGDHRTSTGLALQVPSRKDLRSSDVDPAIFNKTEVKGFLKKVKREKEKLKIGKEKKKEKKRMKKGSVEGGGHTVGGQVEERKQGGRREEGEGGASPLGKIPSRPHRKAPSPSPSEIPTGSSGARIGAKEVLKRSKVKVCISLPDHPATLPFVPPLWMSLPLPDQPPTLPWPLFH
jgi:hypothetical protein